MVSFEEFRMYNEGDAIAQQVLLPYDLPSGVLTNFYLRAEYGFKNEVTQAMRLRCTRFARWKWVWAIAWAEAFRLFRGETDKQREYVDRKCYQFLCRMAEGLAPGG